MYSDNSDDASSRPRDNTHVPFRELYQIKPVNGERIVSHLLLAIARLLAVCIANLFSRDELTVINSISL
jgi:hypothetical protein